ncbi:MAG TPA: NAD+ synthase [Steroidobacteraceae bacterium]|nr:NAD+ synthase [Steroidobacteraceae bacterium]
MQLRVALAQINPTVGDMQGNAGRIALRVEEARRAGAQLVATPELALSGYPPEDLLFHRGFRRRVEESLARLSEAARGIDLLVGYPEYSGGVLFNSAAWIRDGRRIANYRKQRLPNYQVFDEKRYFTPGDAFVTVELGGVRIAPIICEDIWHADVAEGARRAGADFVIALNASPYQQRKQVEREANLGTRARENGIPFAYLNLVGGQDELVFDGCSFAVDAAGRVVHRAPAFQESLTTLDIEQAEKGFDVAPESLAPLPDREESVWRAIVMGVRDYVDKHRFEGVVIGLSGGVDSALVLALACDALGRDRVQAVMMPSRFTSSMSEKDAAAMARGLGVKFSVIPIEGMYQATLAALEREFRGREPDATEENIQARCRGMLLMAISNKTGRMVLTTGNKSEMSVGYATLYGDMAGGFAPIKDCSKLLVWRLARWRNAQGTAPVIPQRIIDRPPTAELSENQLDSDSLPPYEVLDPILEAFIEDDRSVDEIVAMGFERATVTRVLELVKRSEYKRRQAPPGVRISRRAFGRDWRYPITSGYRPGES